MDKAKWLGTQIETVCGQSICCSLLWYIMHLVGEGNNSSPSKMMESWAWWSLSPAQEQFNRWNYKMKHKKTQLFKVSGNCPKDILQWRDVYSRKFAKLHYERQESVVYEPRPASFPQPHVIKLYPEPSTLDRGAQEQKPLPQLTVWGHRPAWEGPAAFSLYPQAPCHRLCALLQ